VSYFVLGLRVAVLATTPIVIIRNTNGEAEKNNCVHTFELFEIFSPRTKRNFFLRHEMKTHLPNKINHIQSEVVSQENFTLLKPNATVNSAKSNR
jgi:hypothetical protein